MARGGVLYRGASRSAYQVTETGTAGQVLTSNGAGADPTFEDATGGSINQLTGDVTAGPGTGSQVATIANDAVTFAKMQNISTDRLLGRDTASSGNVEEITVGGGVEFTGSTGIQRSALTGDVTATAGSNATTIANDTVTYAKMQNISATSRILGRKTSGAGDTEECTLSEVLDFIGSAAQGDILYRGASGWARLGAGTDGQFLKTQGAAANPLWAAVSASESGGGGGHIHGLQRMLGDGSTTTFNLLDFAEYLEHVGVNGSFVDPLTFTLSADQSQITFDSAPGAGQVITLEYVMAGM